MNIEEVAEKYAIINKAIPNDFYEAEILCKKYYKAGILSDAAKQYWFEIFKAEQEAKEEEQFNMLRKDVDKLIKKEDIT